MANQLSDWEKAKQAAGALLEPYRPDHPRVQVFVGFEVEPAIWSDCPHCEEPAEALAAALREDHWGEEQRKREKEKSES